MSFYLENIKHKKFFVVGNSLILVALWLTKLCDVDKVVECAVHKEQ